MFKREEEFKTILKSIGRSDNTIKAYTRDLRFLLKEEDVPTLSSIQDRIYLMAGYGAKPATIRRFLSSVKTYCALFGIEINFKKIAKPKLVQRESSFITDSVFSEGIGMILADELLNEVDSKFRCLFFDFLYQTGLRVSELLSLTQDTFNKDGKYIQIVGKGNKQRKIPIHHNIIKVFDLDWFFNKLESTPYNTVLYWTKKYFGKEYSPHSFRHGYTTKLIKKGVSERSIQKVLGHESFMTTLRYFHLNHDEIQEEILTALED